MSAKDFESIGVPMPRRTFLDKTHPYSVGASAGIPQPRAPPSAPHTSRPATRGSAGQGSGIPASDANFGTDGALRGAVDTKAVILAEHKIELLDMLQEGAALLKNVYRSKFVLGEQLKYVDPSYAGDAVGQFNLATPPMFDPAYSVPNPIADEAEDEAAARAAVGARSGGGGGAADESVKERLRTAEELIKKLYRRNTQLEVENKYVKSEIAKLERLQGLSRSSSHNLSVTDGHIPLDHPLYTKKLRRNCRSVPPQRTMLRTAVNGFGLTFPARSGQREEPQPKEDPLPVAQLKRRVLQLTEALVSVQHDNEVLTAERLERVSARDQLLKRYFAERDQQITHLHSLLQELIAKVNNPMKLARAKQPALSINPVVAHQNVVREVSQRLADQIAALTGDIVKTSSNALPPDDSPPQSPNRGGAATLVDDGTGHLSGESREAGSRRKELSRRLRAIVDTLPVMKRKQLLLLMTELKELYLALAQTNVTLTQAFDQYKARSNADAIQLKMQVALLRDQLRSLGAAEDVMMQAAVAGTSGLNKQASQQQRDP